MTQLTLLKEYEKDFSELLTLHYEGTSKELLVHEINAKALL